MTCWKAETMSDRIILLRYLGLRNILKLGYKIPNKKTHFLSSSQSTFFFTKFSQVKKKVSPEVIM